MAASDNPEVGTAMCRVYSTDCGGEVGTAMCRVYSTDCGGDDWIRIFNVGD